MNLFSGDIKELQADLQADIPTLEESEARVIAGGLAGLDALLRGLIEGYEVSISISIKATKTAPPAS